MQWTDRRGGRESRRPRVTRATAMVGSVAGWAAIFVGIPVAVARRGRHAGWVDGRPGPTNRLGLVPLALSAAGLTWVMFEHYPKGGLVEVSLTPEFLIGSGPYRFSRNPMYVCEATMVAGWCIYYGSPALLAGVSALGAGMRYAVGREERTLDSRFGESWQKYVETVPRWF